VLTDADAQGAGAVLSLGDVVGYGADPGPCLELVAARAQAQVAGNHEWAVCGRMGLEWFNPAARAAAVWTARQLDPEAGRFLAALPVAAALADAHLVHASPRAPEEWDYLLDAEEGFAVFRDFDTRLCFVGHSHRPAVWSLGSGGPEHVLDFQPYPAEIALHAGRRYLINVGSVGQPRDRDPRAAYAIWEPDAARVEIRRVPYDHRTAAQKILDARLPRALAERLARGA
jgi:diadenosine tetraphosphatase ApaH/serine/threonine PP2A family protein phosphatase